MHVDLQTGEGLLVSLHVQWEHIQESTKQGNPRTTRQIKAAHKTALAKGEAGIAAPKSSPLFSDLGLHMSGMNLVILS